MQSDSYALCFVVAVRYAHVVDNDSYRNHSADVPPPLPHQHVYIAQYMHMHIPPKIYTDSTASHSTNTYTPHHYCYYVCYCYVGFPSSPEYVSFTMKADPQLCENCKYWKYDTYRKVVKRGCSHAWMKGEVNEWNGEVFVDSVGRYTLFFPADFGCIHWERR
jgi:hypothetical protein